MKTKKENKLSLWKLSYRTSYYWTHPWKWVKDIYWNVRNFIHRGRYGFAYSDVWGWYYWWPTVGAEALRYMAEHHAGYPGHEPWETPEIWKAYLLEMADKLDWCVESCDISPDFHNEKNEYFTAYSSIARSIFDRTYRDEPETQELSRKYWCREEELSKEDDEERIRIFKEIGEHLGRFWD